MLGNEDTENRLNQLEAKVEELTKQLEETDESIGDLEDSFESDKANMFSVDQNAPPFQVHWITPDETESFSSCDDIDSVAKAQKAFKEAADHRDSSVKRVLHGDVLFLLCNTAPEVEESESESESEEERGVCYYIGMCVQMSTVQMKKDPDSAYDELTETILTDAGEPNREFFAWSSCGGAGEVDCDREEEYITVVTETKVEVDTTGTAPEKTHTIQGYEKTRELQFDECGTLISVGSESEWTAVGQPEIIKECCEESECVTGSYKLYIGSSYISDLTARTATCDYRSSNETLAQDAQGVWELIVNGVVHSHTQNGGPTGNYEQANNAGITYTVQLP